MRISLKDKQSIIQVAEGMFDKHMALYLFGSRVKDHLKGGDIDLLILSDKELYREQIRQFKIRLEDRLGKRKIDIIQSLFEIEDTFVNIIKEEAVKLWERN